MNIEIPQTNESLDTDELAQRIIDIDKALEVGSEGGESNLKRAQIRDTYFKELQSRMSGETDEVREGAAATYIEKQQSEDSSSGYDELAA